MRIDLEASSVERIQSFGVAVEKGAAVLQQDVRKVVEPALCGDAGVKLANGAGSGVAGIGEERQALWLRAHRSSS